MTTSGHSRMVKTSTPGSQNPPSPSAAEGAFKGKALPKGGLVMVPSHSLSPVLFQAPPSCSQPRITCMEVDSHSQGGPRHRHKSI